MLNRRQSPNFNFSDCAPRNVSESTLLFGVKGVSEVKYLRTWRVERSSLRVADGQRQGRSVGRERGTGSVREVSGIACEDLRLLRERPPVLPRASCRQRPQGPRHEHGRRSLQPPPARRTRGRCRPAQSGRVPLPTIHIPQGSWKPYWKPSRKCW